jgi:DNA-binding CsgD family transcriptional regulator
VAIGLFRPEDAPSFAEADRRLIADLLPHFNRAMRLRQQLEAAGSARMIGQAALDALAVGVAVVDRNLRVVMINGMAEQLAASGEGICLGRLGPGSGSPTHLYATHDGERRMLARLVANAVGGGSGGGMRFTRPAHPLPIAALVMPLPARFASAPGGSSVAPGLALVLMRDLDVKAMPAAAWLGTLFGLTEAEAAVAIAAVNGTAAEAIASARGTSPLTVRKQIRSILEKSGTANLRELTRIFAIVPEPGPKSKASSGGNAGRAAL